MVPGPFLWFFKVQGWFFIVPGPFSWFLRFQVVFSRFLVSSFGFQGSRLVFNGSRWVFVVFDNSRLVFIVFKVRGWVFKVPCWFQSELSAGGAN